VRSKARIIKGILIAIVAIIILQITIFSRDVGQERIFKPLFWELKNGMWKDIWLNILLFMPLGLIIGGRKGIISGLILSCCIEFTQYMFCLGYCEMDDVLNNTIGAVIGVGIRSLLGVDSVALRRWEELPEFMRTPEVRPYWEKLNKKRWQLGLKRAFDLCVGGMVLLITAVPMVVIAVAIKLDSKGPVFYRQERVTTYGKKFKIHKFRTMVFNADQIGTAVTVSCDSRITAVGKKLRNLRLDELPQVFDVLSGDMSFVGTRPEVTKYVKAYKPEFYATLLMPAGITSEASIRYKDEYSLLSAADDVDKVYIEQVLPAKMVWNLESVRRFRFLREILTMFRTVAAVLGKDYN
jgi:lipopolysaccharide/colanic/teichoic acid biosynthesis glycosyltransferase